jgi:PIN domain nuclease of toxin-antitoxin system
VRALLDTSVLIWWLSEPLRLSPAARESLGDPDAEVLFSQVSLLEIQIKASLGKLSLDFPVDRIPSLAAESGLTDLPLSNAAIFTLPKLPSLHRDPFDRLLICSTVTSSRPALNAA